MPAEDLIGVAVAVFALQTTMLNAYVLLAIIGMLGASSWCRSMRCCRSGASIRSVPAMRSRCKTRENAAMLLMLALYSLVVKLGVPVVGVGVGFGVVFALAISVCGGRSGGKNGAQLAAPRLY